MLVSKGLKYCPVYKLVLTKSHTCRLVLHFIISPVEGDRVWETDIEAGSKYPTMQRTSSLRDKQLFPSEGGGFFDFYPVV